MEKIILDGEIVMNCYFIEHNKKCYIVDPGYEKQRIVEYVNDKGYEVLGILLTHGHLDHIGALDCFDVPIYVYEKEYDIVINDGINGFRTLGIANHLDYSKLNIVKYDLDQEFMLDDQKIEVIYTPGHTRGGVCFLFNDDLYTGDTLFKGAVGRWDFPTGKLEQLKHSIVQLLDSLDDNIKVHPGHGESSTVLEEKNFNQYYKMWKEEISK